MPQSPLSEDIAPVHDQRRISSSPLTIPILFRAGVQGADVFAARSGHGLQQLLRFGNNRVELFTKLVFCSISIQQTGAGAISADGACVCRRTEKIAGECENYFVAAGRPWSFIA